LLEPLTASAQKSLKGQGAEVIKLNSYLNSIGPKDDGDIATNN
jgi:hypothetical protein